MNTITGKVIDKSGKPILGVTVLVKGTNVGTTTDVDGLYVVKAYDNQILEFRLIGFATKELAVSGQLH